MTNIAISLTLQVNYQKGTQVDENELRAAFENYGSIADIRFNTSGALIDFVSHNDAITAMRALNDPATMKVSLAPGEGERLRLPQEVYGEPKVFVAPINPEWDEEAVRENFGEFGDITEVVMLNKGGAFVKYEFMKQAVQAINYFAENPVQHPGANRLMKVSLATRKEDVNVAGKNFGRGSPRSNATQIPGKIAFETSSRNGGLQNGGMIHSNGGAPQTYQPSATQYSPFNVPVSHPSPMNGPNAVAPMSMPSKDLKGPMGANIFVHNHPTNFSQTDLENLFSPYGQILSLNTQFDKVTKQSKGYSFVSYSNPQSAKRAISELNGAVFNGKKIEVSIKKGETAGPFARNDQRAMTPPRQFHVPFAPLPAPQQPHQLSNQVPGGKLFVRIGTPISDDQLLRLFAPFGSVLECALQKDPSGRPKNFGFVNYDSVVSAVQAVKALHGTMSPDSTVPLDVSIKKGEEHYAEPFARMPMTKGPEGCNLFVRKIPDTWTEDDLVLRFSPFGEVWSVKINVDPKTGAKKGFGFVSFGNIQHANSAIAQMNGQTFEGRWTLDVSVKVPKTTN